MATEPLPTEPLAIEARAERWPIRGEFRTAKVTRRETTVVVVEARRGGSPRSRRMCALRWLRRNY